MEAAELQLLSDKIEKVEYSLWEVDKLIPYERNPRKNDHVVEKMANQIKKFGMPLPLCILPDGLIVDGHLRYKASKRLGLTKVPVAISPSWTPEEVKAFRLAVNKSAEWADWDFELLPVELDDLRDVGFDMELTGFVPAELNELIGTPNTVDDPSGEWNGMPEFTQEDKTAFRSLIVHFKDQIAVNDFAKLLFQNITDKTKYLWFPQLEHEVAVDKRYAVNDSKE